MSKRFQRSACKAEICYAHLSLILRPAAVTFIPPCTMLICALFAISQNTTLSFAATVRVSSSPSMRTHFSSSLGLRRLQSSDRG
jgi:hypothetical protein